MTMSELAICASNHRRRQLHGVGVDRMDSVGLMLQLQNERVVHPSIKTLRLSLHMVLEQPSIGAIFLLTPKQAELFPNFGISLDVPFPFPFEKNRVGAARLIVLRH